MTIDRIVDAFPPHQQAQVRMQLSLTLAGVISQFLIPRRDEEGRVPAVEVMIANSAVRNLIREGKTHQLPNVIQTKGNEGMQSMEQALKELYMKGVISQEDATATANDPDNLQTLMSNG
jgi:twitching motility protein PilT